MQPCYLVMPHVWLDWDNLSWGKKILILDINLFNFLIEYGVIIVSHHILPNLLSVIIVSYHIFAELAKLYGNGHDDTGTIFH